MSKLTISTTLFFIAMGTVVELLNPRFVALIGGTVTPFFEDFYVKIYGVDKTLHHNS